MKQALVFPGQGSQSVGMGKEIAAAFPVAAAVYQEVDDALNQHLSRIIFEGPDADLILTENAQPAIMATSIAILRVLEKEMGFSVANASVLVAGHSLGEYSALVAAGAISLADTARLLKLRGQSMQKAVPQGEGAMAAVLGLDYAAVKEVADAATMDDETCAVANDNAPGQVVVSGSKAAVDRAILLAKEKGAKRAVLLEVSAPFHSPLMQYAEEVMAEALAKAIIKVPCVPLVANITAQAEHNVDAIRNLLTRQVTGMVRWRESVHYMKAEGITQITEIGHGKVLTGLIKRIEPEIVTMNVGSASDLDIFAKSAA